MAVIIIGFTIIVLAIPVSTYVAKKLLHSKEYWSFMGVFFLFISTILLGGIFVNSGLRAVDSYSPYLAAGINFTAAIVGCLIQAGLKKAYSIGFSKGKEAVRPL